MLSKVDKAIHIKTVVQAIPTYSMSTFKVPIGICKKMDRGSRLGSKGYLALKAWGALCKTKESGGLGFRKFEEINLALLSKLAWRMAREDDSLWARTLRARYLKGKTFFELNIKKRRFSNLERNYSSKRTH